MKKITVILTILFTIGLVTLVSIELPDDFVPKDGGKNSDRGGETARPESDPGQVARFSDGFEGVTRFEDLFPKDSSRWHGTQLDPQENQIELTTALAHSGKNALHFFAKARTGSKISKADIDRQLFHFQKGDNVWFTGWYFISAGTDTRDMYLWDLEDSTIYQNPGRRVYIQEGEYLASDLGKTIGGKIFRQERGKAVKVPKEKWFQMKIHIFLSDGQDGRMEVWQDQVKVIDGKGKTLPSASSVYDRLQVGLTANANAKNDQTLYLDDVAISRQDDISR